MFNPSLAADIQDLVSNFGLHTDAFIAHLIAFCVLAAIVVCFGIKPIFKQLEERRHNIAKREEKRLADAAELKAVLESKAIKVEARIGEEGQLFGSVTGTNIADAIKQQLEVEVDRKRIARSQAIKQAGRHQVEVDLYRDINATVTVLVGVEEEEPEAEQEPKAAAEEAAEE